VTDRIPDGVIDLAHRMARAGLVVAAGGNIAARISDDRIWVTPSGWSLADLRVADLVQVTLDGHHVDGVNAPTSELLLHLAALRARPDVVWSVHLHPPIATLLHGLDIPIRTLTTDHAFYLRAIATVPYLHPGSARLADAAAAELTAGADVVLLRHHGCLVLGDTPDLVLYPGRQPRGSRRGYLPSPFAGRPFHRMPTPVPGARPPRGGSRTPLWLTRRETLTGALTALANRARVIACDRWRCRSCLQLAR
jgi:ribulose-5-phosphate 4-epimerase/fuculose-1-phosphate aldolase